MLPRTSFYCTTFSPNSIIPVQIFTLRWLFSTSPYICRFIVTILVSDWLRIYHLQVRLLRRFSSAWTGFLWTLFRISLSIISRRCFAYFAVDHLFTRFSSVCKGILFTHFQCSIWIGVIKKSHLNSSSCMEY